MKVHPPFLRILSILLGAVLAAILLVTVPQAKHEATGTTQIAVASKATPTSTPDASTGKPATLVPRQEPPSQAGMVVGIDPETGKLGMPTQEQRAELDEIAARDQASLSRSAVGLVEEVRPNGTVHLNLQGRFQDFVTVQLGPGGTKTYQCVDDSLGFARTTKAASVTAPALEER